MQIDFLMIYLLVVTLDCVRDILSNVQTITNIMVVNIVQNEENNGLKIY